MSIFDLFNKLERQKSTASGPPEWLIVGLGNPGKKYELSRHNTGFLALDSISGKYSIRVNTLKFKGICGQGTLGGKNVLLLKPQTFMNASGQSVRDAAAFYKIPMERVLVLFDDVSLPVGRIRIRQKGSAGGHNGIKDIIRLCGTEEFPRIKIGAGAPTHPDYDLADWVLGGFSKEEMPDITSALDRAAAAVIKIITDGAERAASEFN